MSKKHGEWSKEAQNLTLIHGDILDPASFYILPPSYSIVANIPYYITGAILEKFLEHGPRPSRMILLVQKEVAERIVARPPDGKKPDRKKLGDVKAHGKESILSISVKAFGTPRIIANVPRGAFTPAPSVDSAILAIENISGAHFRGDGSAENKQLVGRFFDIVRSGFAHKRKFLIRNLEAVATGEKLAIIWKKLELDEKVRAEDLAVEDWLRIRDTIIS